MKTLRYLLIVMMVVLSSVSAKAQNSNHQSDSYTQMQNSMIGFRSTSTMQGSGSSIPTAAEYGVTFSDNLPEGDVQANAPGHLGNSRRARPDDWQDPMENPIGDGVWAMLLMAAGYLLYRVRTRKREVTA